MNARILKKLSKRAEPYIKRIISNPVNEELYLNALELREFSPMQPTFDIRNYADNTVFFCEWIDVVFAGDFNDDVWVECPAYELLSAMIAVTCDLSYNPCKTVSETFAFAEGMA